MRLSTACLCAFFYGCFAACATRNIYVGADIEPAAGRPSVEASAAGASVREAVAGSSGSGQSAAARPLVCSGSRADCDGDMRNGCEADLTNDAAHCGECALSCQSPDCMCRDGKLQTVCPVGRGDCDGNPRNGCEVDTQSSVEHCGTCGTLCRISGHDAIGVVCMAGHCRAMCQVEISPEGDCDGNPDNGCETNLWTNENCGACGVRCSCNAGVCR